jgi:hypothetical protein
MTPNELDKLEEDIKSKLKRDTNIRKVSSKLEKVKTSRNLRG